MHGDVIARVIAQSNGVGLVPYQTKLNQVSLNGCHPEASV